MQYKDSLAKKRVQNGVALKRRAKSLPNLNIGSQDFQKISSSAKRGTQEGRQVPPSSVDQMIGDKGYLQHPGTYSDKTYIRAFIGDIGHAFIRSKAGKKIIEGGAITSSPFCRNFPAYLWIS